MISSSFCDLILSAIRLSFVPVDFLKRLPVGESAAGMSTYQYLLREHL